MCGRITQYRSSRAYAEAIGWDTSDARRWKGGRVPFYNIPPGTWPEVMHMLHDGIPNIDTLHWGYRPKWAIEKGFPQQINARIESAVAKPYYRGLMKAGRVIVPADGWYEWTGEKGHKKPWYIHLQTDRPMFLAAITNWRPYVDNPEGTGFVIVTAAAEAGLVDVHDRRPVALAPEDAQLWMDHSFSAEQAEQIARGRSLPTEAFEWYQVSTDVNKVGNNDAHLIEPV
jgi:putative SOS response-associated peptidase YedK